MVSYMQISLAEMDLDLREVYRSMGYRGNTPEADICALCQELISEVEQIARPSFYYQIFDCDPSSESLKVGDTEFMTGKIISSLMKRSSSAAVFVATAGWQVQRWLDEISASGDALRLFIADAIASTIVEAMGDRMELDLEQRIGDMLHTNRFSPGYCKWDIREQQKLFKVLSDQRCEITLNDSCLMQPIKSISGVIGIGKDVITKKYGCAICQRADCYMRKS
ncbi:MAG: vitamin B12 dependent-methionine synthase activation domain-containing protein [Rikenellaceae bacterium]